VAEIQALRRKAAAEHRRGIWEAWWSRLSRVSRRAIDTRFAREGQ